MFHKHMSTLNSSCDRKLISFSFGLINEGITKHYQNKLMCKLPSMSPLDK